MQTAMVLTSQKPIQRNHFGEVPEGLPGSTLEHGMCEEKHQELGRPCLFLLVEKRLARDADNEPRNGETLDTE